jgi:predicted transcriptional regulator
MSKDEKRPRGRPKAEGASTRQMSIRIGADDDAQLDTLANKLAGFEKTNIARAALRAGLTLLELEPAAIVQALAPAAKRKSWLRGLLRRDEDGRS